MFGSDEIWRKGRPIGTFIIIFMSHGPYYNAPMKICVEEKYVRASPVEWVSKKCRQLRSGNAPHRGSKKERVRPGIMDRSP